MLFQDKRGEGVEVDVASPGAARLMALIRGGTDEQIRGMFARILRDSGIPADRAARVLRVKRTTYFCDLARPFPGINDDPEAGDA